MKVETRQPFWYNGFTTNPSTSRKETSPHGKIIPDLLPEMQQPSKLLSLRQRPTWEPEISLPRMRASICAGRPCGRQARETRAFVLIRSALSAGRPYFSTTTTSITQITSAATRNAAISFLFRSRQPFRRLPCPNFSAKPISSGCAILCISF